MNRSATSRESFSLLGFLFHLNIHIQLLKKKSMMTDDTELYYSQLFYPKREEQIIPTQSGTTWWPTLYLKWSVMIHRQHGLFLSLSLLKTVFQNLAPSADMSISFVCTIYHCNQGFFNVPDIIIFCYSSNLY